MRLQEEGRKDGRKGIVRGEERSWEVNVEGNGEKEIQREK